MPGIGLIQQIVGVIALVALLSLLLLWKAADRRADKWEAQALKLSAELRRISTEKDEQKAATDKAIAKGRERIVYVDRVAKEIEKAPLPGQCRTPGAILKADL
jgi:hypothetical protein